MVPAVVDVEENVRVGDEGDGDEGGDICGLKYREDHAAEEEGHALVDVVGDGGSASGVEFVGARVQGLGYKV